MRRIWLFLCAYIYLVRFFSELLYQRDKMNEMNNAGNSSRKEIRLAWLKDKMMLLMFFHTKIYLSIALYDQSKTKSTEF